MARRAWIASGAVAALLLGAADSAGAAFGPVRFDVPRPCVALRCAVTVSAPALTPMRMQVSFDHRGTGASGFVAQRSTRCAPVDAPDALYTTVAPSCRLSARMRRAGRFVVAVRLSDQQGAASFARRTIRVLPAARSRGGGHTLCRQSHPSDKCQPGGGRRVPGGGEKVSHKGWPAITGVFWQVTGNAGRRFTGGALNDELLGHHGSDRIVGRGGKDVLWGDWNPVNNNTRQRDVLDGGPGNDWIYSSHGKNTIRGGAGKDYIWAYYGRGTINCGPGFDTLRIKADNRYHVRNCERIKNFCAHGSKPGNKGGCYKPGEKPRR